MFKKSITLLQWWFTLPRYQLEPKRVFHLRTTVLCQYIFPAESTQQSLRGLFGFFKTKPSLKSFRRRGADKVFWNSKEKTTDEKSLKVSPGGQLNEIYWWITARLHYARGVVWKQRFHSENTSNVPGSVHTTQQSPVILDLCLRKIWQGKSRDYRDVTVFENLCFHNDFRPHEKTTFSNFSGLKSVFQKFRFLAGLVWTLGLTGEIIKLRFQIPLA